MSSLERIFKSLLIESYKRNSGSRAKTGRFTITASRSSVLRIALIKLQELKDVISGNIRVLMIYSIGLHDLPQYVTKSMKGYSHCVDALNRWISSKSSSGINERHHSSIFPHCLIRVLGSAFARAKAADLILVHSFAAL
jgi:hypothetical protein